MPVSEELLTREISFLCFRYILFSTVYFLYCVIWPLLGLAMALLFMHY